MHQAIRPPHTSAHHLGPQTRPLDPPAGQGAASSPLACPRSAQQQVVASHSRNPSFTATWPPGRPRQSIPGTPEPHQEWQAQPLHTAARHNSPQPPQYIQPGPQGHPPPAAPILRRSSRSLSRGPRRLQEPLCNQLGPWAWISPATPYHRCPPRCHFRGPHPTREAGGVGNSSGAAPRHPRPLPGPKPPQSPWHTAMPSQQPRN
ncbi:hypothetical protein NDU88_007490 [Pleurodeles waltl]|uniref:Uncharacterized protein n=1 Tax=Pleurodeles waltl TaxID=8319 RepID=A0AAV7VUL8_PLEWA|nr:hypothetical protein NDU88_007490 [Pleurodeles waltl]